MSQAGRTALGGSAMDGFSLVLNAGSSSLKFCIFQHAADQALRVDTRGVVEGIGNEPRLLVRNAAGALLEKHEVNASDGRGAVKELAEWIRSKYCGAAVLGVGHRVVHGGQRSPGRLVVRALHMRRVLPARVAGLAPAARRRDARLPPVAAA